MVSGRMDHFEIEIKEKLWVALDGLISKIDHACMASLTLEVNGQLSRGQQSRLIYNGPNN